MILLFLHSAVVIAVAMRVLLRPNRDPAARAAWMLTLIVLPVAGVVAYAFLGETWIGRRRLARLRQIEHRVSQIRPPTDTALRDAGENDAGGAAAALAAAHAGIFHVGHSISGFAPTCGNRMDLMDDSNSAIDAMISDIDAAHDHVHVMFYIWADDRNGRRMAKALERAAARGVVCRALADDIGSRRMIRSQAWRDMARAGVRLAVAFRVGNPFLRLLINRIDLRNHRKIVVIDAAITYCGSQNCADPEFVQKAKYAPWVDVMMRIEGPVVAQNQRVFAVDWMESADEDLTQVLKDQGATTARDGRPQTPRMAPPQPADTAIGHPREHTVAQVVASGPTARPSAISEMFTSLIYAAQHELVISTPYYVPTEPLQSALCAAANRGVAVTLVLPARNDSHFVAAASRSYYADLLGAGVRLLEYQPGLLHAKTLTADGQIGFIGSANMDRRSFELNYENNILFVGPETCAVLRERQDVFAADARLVTESMVKDWPMSRRIWQNLVSILGPVL